MAHECYALEAHQPPTQQIPVLIELVSTLLAYGSGPDHDLALRCSGLLQLDLGALAEGAVAVATALPTPRHHR